MRVLRSPAQPDLTYVLLTDKDAEALRQDLRKAKSPFSRRLRAEIKKVLRA